MTRDRHDIIAEILSYSEQTKYSIMHGIGLSHTLTKEYINLLVNTGMISPTTNPQGHTVYVTTEKGRKLYYLIELTNELLGGIPN